MKLLLLVTLAVTPFLGDVAFANTAHGNTDRGNPGPHVLYLGDRAVATGGTAEQVQALQSALQSEWARTLPATPANSSAKPAG